MCVLYFSVYTLFYKIIERRIYIRYPYGTSHENSAWRIDEHLSFNNTDFKYALQSSFQHEFRQAFEPRISETALNNHEDDEFLAAGNSVDGEIRS